MISMISLLAVVFAATTGVAPASPAKLAPAVADSLRAIALKDREDTREWLRAKPTSYLATVQRRDFGNRAMLTIGRDVHNDMRIDDPEISGHHLRVTVEGDSFHVVAVDPTATFTVKDQERREATLPPSQIGVGRFTLRLSHQRFPAIIVFDPKNPGFSRYKGLEWFPLDFRYRYELALTPNPAADTVIILSTRGNERRALRVGWFDFRVNGRTCRLEASRLLEPGVDEHSLSVFFRDATTAKTTYDVGRYVDPQPLPNGNWVLDFNNAYNPACAVSDHYNCPIPPRANVLSVAIMAGEKDSHYHEHP